MRRKRIPGETTSQTRQIALPRLGDVALLEVSQAANDHDEDLVSEQLRQLIRTAPILLIAHFIGGLGLLYLMYRTGDAWLTATGLGLVSLTLFFDAVFSSIARLKVLHNRPPYVGARIATATRPRALTAAWRMPSWWSAAGGCTEPPPQPLTISR